MINLLRIVILTLIIIHFLQRLLGTELLTDAIRYALEIITRYRNIDSEQGFVNKFEMTDFSKSISHYFTAITSINQYYDEFGWQYAEYEIMPLPSGNSPGIQTAISIEARNYIKQRHGIDNPDVIVPTLTDNFLCIRIPCSKKAHEQAKAMDFSPLPQHHAPLEEEIK